MKTILIKVALAALTLGAIPRADAETSSRALPRTILFVDDEDVLYRSGTLKRVAPFEKFDGNPVIFPDRPWEAGSIAWTSLYHDAKRGRYQLWYSAYNQRKGDRTLENVVCYAESSDGRAWSKPSLGLFPFYEEKDTNIVLVGTGGYGSRYCCSVIVDERDPNPARRYKMVYYDWAIGADAHRGSGTHVAFSPDGIRWTKQGSMVLKTGYGGKGQEVALHGEDGHVEFPSKNGGTGHRWNVPMTMSDAADVFYDGKRDAFVIYGKMWIDGPDGKLSWKHAMGRTESRDFVHWSRPQLVLATNDRDPTMMEFHTSPVFPYNGLYLSLNQVLDRKAGTIDIELMSSRDGFKWERPYTQTPILPRGVGPVFDAGSIFTNSTPVVLKDEIRFYYGAYRGTAIGGVGFDRQKIGSRDFFSGIGYATARRDRFVSVAPDPASSARNPRPVVKPDREGRVAVPPQNTLGQVTLRALDLTGVKSITVNAKAVGGAVRVEVLDEDGFRMRGFTRDDAVPMQADGLDQTVAWKGHALGDLPPGRYLLRIHLDNAELFAVTLK